MVALGTSVVLAVLSGTVGVPGGGTRFGSYLDAAWEPTLPNWWSTVLFSTAAAAHALVASLAARSGIRGAGAWATGAATVAVLSVAEHTSLFERVGGGVLRIPAGAVGLAVLLVVAAVLRGRPGVLLAAGAVLIVATEVGGDVLADVLAPGGGAPLVHVAELGENAGAVLLAAAAGAALGVDRDRGTVRVTLRGCAELRAGSLRGRPRWGRLAVAATLALSAASLVVVLGAGLLEPDLRGLRLYLDVLVEDNLPSWWSSALLLVAAFVHGLVAVAHRAGGLVGARYWTVSAGLLGLFALDDQTQLHERTETIGRALLDGGGYPFLWLVPGAVVGAAVALAVVLLALRSPPPVRVLLLGGITLFLGCALGLEAVQGLLMADGDEGVPFAVLYHLEELGENLAALMLVAAAARALHVERTAAGLAFRTRPPAHVPAQPASSR